MATTTTNLALIKPAGTDKIRIAQINSNMDILDDKIGPVGNTSLQEQLNNKQGALTFDSVPTSGSTNPVTSGGIYTEAGNLAEAMAILSNNNTHVAISSGQYVYVRGHGTLAEGLYKATAAIAANGTLSTSNLQAVSNGGLNALKSSVDTLNSKITDIEYIDISGPIASTYSSITNLTANLRRIGRVCIITLQFKTSVAITSGYAVLGNAPYPFDEQAHAPLSGLNSHGGFATLYRNNLNIRCDASGNDWIVGELIYFGNV